MNTSNLPESPDGGHDKTIQGHNYDGIQEYDNPMPAWWVWIFVACVAFAPIYVLGVHVFGFINTYEDDLAESEHELQVVREAYAAAHPAFVADEATLASYQGKPDQIAAGAALFGQQCKSCHGENGQGLIGPNLTDKYWLHGNTDVDLFNTISKGVLDKGMPPWEAVFTPEQRAQLIAFIRSIAGTMPADAKAPQGDLYE